MLGAAGHLSVNQPNVRYDTLTAGDEMPLLHEIVPHLKKGMWASRPPSKKNGWGKDCYILLEDGELVFRAGAPGERSVTTDFVLALDDIAYGGWKIVDPDHYIGCAAAAHEQRLVPWLQSLGGSFVVSRQTGENYDRSIWWTCVRDSDPRLIHLVDGDRLRVGWGFRLHEKQGELEFAREFKRGYDEWNECVTLLQTTFDYKQWAKSQKVA
jgi:hypothetical protein